MNSKLSNQDIYDRIYSAISERRLLPGTKLSEERLAQAFRASRTRVREVLLRLGQELIVESHPNRGAFVASPTTEDMRHVFAVRRALERAIAAELSERCGGQPIAPLRAHLESEARARGEGDRAALARLTGDFHVRLAEATGNRIFTENVRRLVALTGLIIAQYDAQASSACPENEHADIVKAIEAGDARRAERLMLQHLDHVESGIEAPAAGAGEVNFERIFGTVEPPAPKKRARRA
ncbi:MAG TPA: GntR family transcriptional regulator [Burkholderiales bacterium]|nr:GntR family transcriptional regulator [Burkholderiales bacterium]